MGAEISMGGSQQGKNWKKIRAVQNFWRRTPRLQETKEGFCAVFELKGLRGSRLVFSALGPVESGRPGFERDTCEVRNRTCEVGNRSERWVDRDRSARHSREAVVLPEVIWFACGCRGLRAVRFSGGACSGKGAICMFGPPVGRSMFQIQDWSGNRALIVPCAI